MATTDDRNSTFICMGKYKYQILAATVLIRGNQPAPELHDREWEAVVTIYRTTENERGEAQSFPHDPQYGATEAEAIAKAHDFGRKLVTGAMEGLKIGPTGEGQTRE